MPVSLLMEALSGHLHEAIAGVALVVVLALGRLGYRRMSFRVDVACVKDCYQAAQKLGIPVKDRRQFFNDVMQQAKRRKISFKLFNKLD